MQHLTYGPKRSYEDSILQQIIQGTHFCSMSFNERSAPIFLARTHCGIAGFILGKKGSGSESHVLTFQGSYLCGEYNNEKDEFKLKMEFARWAETDPDLRVTHYKMKDLDMPAPISAIHHMAPHTAEIFEAPPESEPQIDLNIALPPEQFKYAHH